MNEIVIGFLGCGNVGGGVWKLLQNFSGEIAHRDHVRIRVKKILVRDVNKKRDLDVPHELLTDEPNDVLFDPEISLVAEFLGGEQPATEYMLTALKNGKTVVTANKVALALNWHRLQAEAQQNRVGLYYEASVCGAIPIINALQSPLKANKINKLMGIINGTTNYILSRMAAEGGAYEDVLADAQRLGLAEPDPTSDVQGLDAAYKLSIMASLAFHARVPFRKVYHEGITRVTDKDVAFGKELGYTLKLLAIAKRDGNTIEVRVNPTFLPKDHPLALVNGSFNAVYLHGHACQDMMLQGRGAGDMPTASAVVGDILRAANASVHEHPTFANKAEPDPILEFTCDWKTKYYIRLSAADAPGVLSHVAGCFAQQGISIASMIQRDTAEDGRVPLIFITHEANEQAMQAALKLLDNSLCKVENLIRVEN